MLDIECSADDIVRLLNEGNVPELCTIDDEALFSTVNKMRLQQQLSDSSLATIDEVWRWKTTRLAMTSKVSQQDYLQFANGLSRIANDLSESYLNDFQKKYHARWNGLIDLHMLLAREKRPNQTVLEVPELWKLTAEFIAKSSTGHVSFTALFAYFASTKDYKLKTKGGLTHRIGPQRENEWIETIRDGREMKIYLGRAALKYLQEQQQTVTSDLSPSTKPIKHLRLVVNNTIADNFVQKPTPEYYRSSIAAENLGMQA